MVSQSPMQLLNQMMNMGNPQMIIQNMINQNPQARILFNQMNQSGMSQKDFVLQYARQNNIDINPIIQMMAQRGIKL